MTIGARNAVGLIALRTNTLRKTIPVGAYPSTILYVPKANRVYVVCDHGRRAMLIDPTRERVVGTVTLGGTAAPFACVFPQNNLIYQRLRSSNRLVVIDPLRSTVIKRIRMKKEIGPLSLGMNAPKGGSLYVSKGDDSTAPDLLMLPTGHYALYPADKDAVIFDRTQQYTYTTTRAGGLGTISWDDVNAYDEGSIASVPAGPHAFALNDERHHVYVHSSGDGSVTVFLSSPRYIGRGETYGAQPTLPPKPAIPADLRNRTFHVVVKIRLDFHHDGTLDIKLIESSGIGELDDLCLETYRNITFHPAHEDGYPVDDSHNLRVLFHNP